MEAAACLTLAQLLLAIFPFRWIAARLGLLAKADETFRPVESTQQPRARQIGQAVARAARHLPWTVLCLPQALAARAMLDRRSIAATVHFGMALSDAQPTDGRHRMLAHAWVTVGDMGVVGTPAEGQFAVIARFTREMEAKGTR